MLHIVPAPEDLRNFQVALAGRTGASQPRRVERTIRVDASGDRVWEAITDAAELSQWFGAEVTVDPRPGGRALFRWPGGRERAAVVEEADRPRRFSLRWLPFERDPSGRVLPSPPGRVEFHIHPEGRGARLEVVEWTAPDPLAGSGGGRSGP